MIQVEVVLGQFVCMLPKMNVPTVKAIDRRTVHQICSGQVVVTLSTALKELVENSLDAGATNIEIRLKNWGADCIEVIDNGSGVLPENFQALALKHHTSKLNVFTDLTGVETFGFRGEALSSLCALSNLCVTTCHVSKSIGAKIEYDHDGKIVKQVAAARVPGTTVTLQNLFSTLPVRHKEFLRNLKREYAKLIQVLQGYCVISTCVRFSCYTQSDKGKKNLVLSTNGNVEMRENITNVFGPKQLSSLLEFKQIKPVKEDCEEHGLDLSRMDKDSVFSLTGFVSSCDHGAGRSTTDRQYIFINKRPCDLAKVIRLVNEVYHGFNRNQYPFLVLNISLNKELVDVNVTPDKRQVFLQHEKLLLATIKSSLKTMFDPGTSSYTVNDKPLAQDKLGFSKLQKDDEKSDFLASIKQRLFLAKASGVCKEKKCKSILEYAKQGRNLGTERKVFLVNSGGDPKIGVKQEDCVFGKEIVGEGGRECENENEDNASGEKVSQENANDEKSAKEDRENDGKENGDEENEDRENADRENAGEDNEGRVNENREKHGEPNENGENGNGRNENGEKKDSGPDISVDRVTSVTQDGQIGENFCMEDLQGCVKNKRTKTDMEVKDGLERTDSDVSAADTRKLNQKRKSDVIIEDSSRYGGECSTTLKKIKLDNDSSFDRRKRRSVALDFDWQRLCSKGVRENRVNSKAREEMARTFRAAITPENNQSAEEELQRHFTKEMFGRMKIIGQFNQGFIIAKLKDDLFIIDQHASDEKYNFEDQQKNTVIKSQRLIHPQSLELTAVNEGILIENVQVFKKNGFDFEVDEDAPVSRRVKLVALPVSKNWSFGKSDIDELIFMLSDSPGVSFRPSSVRKMFACRACRKSVMVGTALDTAQMSRIVGHMGEMDHPWNCPHGRPTMRHLINLNMVRK